MSDPGSQLVRKRATYLLRRGIKDGDAVCKREADRPDGERELLGRRRRGGVDPVAKGGATEGKRTVAVGVLRSTRRAKMYQRCAHRHDRRNSNGGTYDGQPARRGLIALCRGCDQRNDRVGVAGMDARHECYALTRMLAADWVMGEEPGEC